MNEAPRTKIPAVWLERFETAPAPQSEDPLFYSRYDIKYVFPAFRLPTILGALADGYRISAFEGRSIQEYESLYLDDDRWTFYQDHQRGKLKRSKVRFRLYPATGFACLEIKTKTNKRSTRKWRRPVSSAQAETGVLTDVDRHFVDDVLNGSCGFLVPAVRIRFSRLTLQARDAAERVTLDTGLSFSDFPAKASVPAGDFIVAEVKQIRPSGDSPFRRLLRDLRIAPTRFSKYCYGVYLFHPELRHNRLKARYLALEKNKIRWANGLQRPLR